MFVVRCLKGPLSIILEKGSITLSPGQKFDLDPFCSRKWLRSNKELNRFILCGFLLVIHDDKTDIAKPPVVSAIRQNKPVVDKDAVIIPLPEDKPVVVNLSDIKNIEKLTFIPEVKADLVGAQKDLDKVFTDKEDVVVVSIPDTPEVEKLCSLPQTALSIPPLEESKIVDNIEDLDKMSWSELRTYAAKIGIICLRKSKSVILAEIKAKRKLL